MNILGKLVVSGVTKRVILATPEEAGEDNLAPEDHASHAEDTNIIWLNMIENLDASTARENLFHELGHAWLLHSGVRFYLKRQLKVTDEEWAGIEEDIVRMLAPSIDTSFDSLKKFLSTLAKKIGTPK